MDKLGVGDQSEGQFDVTSESVRRTEGVCSMNAPNSLPIGGSRCLVTLTNGDPSGFLFLTRPGFPCFLETPYMHFVWVWRQRAQFGCSLLHLTFDAAQASHEALSFRFPSRRGVNGLGAEVGVDILSGVLLLSSMTGDLQRIGRDGVDIMIQRASSVKESVSGKR